MWKDIKGYENKYRINSMGDVLSLNYRNSNKSQLLKPMCNRGGYWVVNLMAHCNRKTETVHRLVALAFIPNPNNKKEINHKDFNKGNNKAYNLEWVTPSENVRYTVASGRQHNPNKGKFGVDNHSSKAVIQCDGFGYELHKFGSMSEAERETGIHVAAISACCRKVKHHLTAGGYKWKYEKRKAKGFPNK